jgi:hypothetical protein
VLPLNPGHGFDLFLRSRFRDVQLQDSLELRSGLVPINPSSIAAVQHCWKHCLDVPHRPPVKADIELANVGDATSEAGQ